jgi:quercetin dioxygenase-like cupin family protein
MPRVRLTRADPSAGDPSEAFRAEGLLPRTWSNGPGDRYGWHSHVYDKVLYCRRGSITFHTEVEEFELRSGDRLDIESGVQHADTVGPEGVECMEASR